MSPAAPNRLRVGPALALLATLLIVAAGRGLGQEGEAKQPIPSAAEQGKAEKNLHRLFQKDFAAAAKDPKTGLPLAQTLLTEAKATRDEAAVMFVGLREAGVLALGAGQKQPWLDAADALAQEFPLSVLAARSEVLAQAVPRCCPAISSNS